MRHYRFGDVLRVFGSGFFKHLPQDSKRFALVAGVTYVMAIGAIDICLGLLAAESAACRNWIGLIGKGFAADTAVLLRFQPLLPFNKQFAGFSVWMLF